MIAPYSMIYQILHSRPGNTVTLHHTIWSNLWPEHKCRLQRQMPANSKHLLQIQAVGFLACLPFPTSSRRLTAANVLNTNNPASQPSLFLFGLFTLGYSQPVSNSDRNTEAADFAFFTLFHPALNGIYAYMTQSQLVFSFQSQGVSKIQRACRNFSKVNG